MGILEVLAALIGIGSLGGVYYERDYIKYHVARARDNGVHTKEFPISIPKELPSMKEISQDIFKYIDPQQFLIGASTSEHQCSTKCTPQVCSFSAYCERKGLPKPTDTRYRMNLWDNYKQYIDDTLSQWNVRDIRFSIEWSLVQPNGSDEWDEIALKHYADLFTYCVKKGIAPLVCFHHYTDPNWFFYDKKGFTKAENVQYFTNYCTKVYEYIMQELQKDPEALQALRTLKHEPLWTTFNAPAGYAFRVHRQQPLDESLKGLSVVTESIKNCCEATVQVSKSLKQRFAQLGLSSDVREPKVGFLKNGLQVDGQEGYTRPVSNFLGGHADYMRHQAIYDFFTNGTFKVQIPGAVSTYHENKDAIGSLDFIGLNYYSNKKLHLIKTVPPTLDNSRKLQGEYYRYPEGMYRAIVELHEKLVQPYERTTGKKLKMFVAENGAATNNDEERDRFYREYLYAISRAVKDGYPVEGYVPWTWFDNYEWPADKDNTERSYGIFSVSEDGKHLALKEGSKALIEFTKQMSALEKKRGIKSPLITVFLGPKLLLSEHILGYTEINREME